MDISWCETTLLQLQCQGKQHASREEQELALIDTLDQGDWAFINSSSVAVLMLVTWQGVSKFNSMDAAKGTFALLILSGQLDMWKPTFAITVASAAASLKEELALDTNPVSRSTHVPYLEMSNFLCCGKGCVLDPVQLCHSSACCHLRKNEAWRGQKTWAWSHRPSHQALSATVDQTVQSRRACLDAATGQACWQVILLLWVNHLPHQLFLSSLAWKAVFIPNSSRTQEKMPLLHLRVYFWKNRGFFFCAFTPPENALDQLVLDLGYSLIIYFFHQSYKLVQVHKSKWQVSWWRNAQAWRSCGMLCKKCQRWWAWTAETGGCDLFLIFFLSFPSCPEEGSKKDQVQRFATRSHAVLVEMLVGR